MTGIKAHTIRIWEKRYNIVDPKRTESNIRYYDDEDLKKLLNVSILHKHGFKISKIANLNESQLNEKISEVSRVDSDFDCQIEGLVVAMIDLNEAKFEKIINTATLNLGFEDTIFKIIYPFFKKVGVLWQTGAINPAQEHFISNLIKLKLMVAIDNQSPAEKTGKKFMLFLPEWEFHEIGLLINYYLIKKQGHSVLYLGQAVPREDLEPVAAKYKPDCLVTSLTASVKPDRIMHLLNLVGEVFPQLTTYISGRFAASLKTILPSNVVLLENVDEFKQIISNQ